jgi:hypothetical protein
MTHDEETGEELQLVWTPGVKYPGRMTAEYKGYALEMVPVGASEFDVIIDGDQRVCGSDTVYGSECYVINHIDGIKNNTEVLVTPL